VATVVALVWAPGAAERTPLNVNTYTYLTGQADKLDPATGKLETVPVAYRSHTQVDPDKSDGDVVVFVNTKCVNVDRGDPPPCLKATDDRLVTNSIDTFATDRHTALSVNDKKYMAKDSVPHEGLVNKWPFNAEKKTYPYWDGRLAKAVDAKYVGTKEYDGLETYEYSVVVPETEAEVLEGTQGTYSAQQSLWIDPRTGSIIDQSGGEIRKLEDGTTILDIKVAYTDATVNENVSKAKDSIRTLDILTKYGPPVAGILGLAMLIGGVLVLRRLPASADGDVENRVPVSV
jgi:hypothetical protein